MSHCPPSNLGLDVCYNNNGVGCFTISEYIMMTRPIISLHGHIHESPQKTKQWFNYYECY